MSQPGPYRLRDTEHGNEDDRRLWDLLKTHPPYRSTTPQKQRIKTKLLARARRRPPPRLRVLLFAAVFIAGSASAAVFGGKILESVTERSAASVSMPAAPANVKDKVSGAKRRVPSAPTPAPEERPPPVVEAPQGPRKAAPASRPVAKPRAQGEDPTRVVEALRALRKEGDPARAQALLGQYLESNPKGALSEDALALSIEAAHARGDRRAKAHARRYLRQFPKGRHRQLAERVLKLP